MVFILPLIPVAMALFTGGVGMLADSVARATEEQAQEIVEDAQSRYEEACEAIKEVCEETQSLAAQYGELKIVVQQNTIGRFVDLRECIDRTCSDLDRSIIDTFEGTKPQQIKDYKSVRLDAISTTTDGMIGDKLVDFAADNVGNAVLALVGLFGHASTGTAISGLSGAAATNATFAWLGGGSVASGGGGMALGHLVFGGITIVPALLIGGFRLAKGDKAIAEALEYQSQVNTTINEIAEEEESQLKLQERICELWYLVNKIDDNAIDILDRLELRPFDLIRDSDSFKQLALLVKSLIEIMDVLILDTNGHLNPEAKILASKYIEFQT